MTLLVSKLPSDSVVSPLTDCTDCLPLIDSECFFFSIMQREAVLILVFVWCIQTVHAQGQ